MNRFSFSCILVLVFCLAGAPASRAQDEPESANDTDGASQQVEESDEAFRRRMELEDARYRDPTYTEPVGSYKRELEKIDKLPEESRDNIRDQLIDVIMTNGEWEPSDALEEYPYTPTAAAQGDPKLAQQEQEAWEEQVEKYHERESEAFGAYRGPLQGPGNPDGPEGSASGSQGGGQEDGQQGQQGGQQGQQGGQQGTQGQQGDQGEQSESGTYQPYQSSNGERSDEESRAGVSESALDFLMGRQPGSQASAQAPGQDSGQAQSQNQAQDAAKAQNQQQSEPTDPSSQQTSQQVAQPESTSQSEDSEQSEEPVQQDLRGILAIEDLDKLGVGTAPPPPPEEEEDDGDQRP